MAMNPVLYNIANLQSGRGTGSFRGVKVAPELRNTEFAQFDKAASDTLLSQLNAMKSDYSIQRAADDARYAALPGLWTESGRLYDSFKPGTKARTFYAAQRDAYQAEYKALPSLINTRLSQYKTALTPLQTQRESLIGSYADETRKADHLAFASPSSENASPTISEGASLAATDLYSDTLESEVIGRKQLAQTTSEPEDDLVSGMVESSIYSRGK